MSHTDPVPLWKSALSFGLRMVPGVAALQYVTGSDWITGEQVDRGSVASIAGAAASVLGLIPGALAIRGAMQAVHGAQTVSAALRAAAPAAATAARTGARLAVLSNPVTWPALAFASLLRSTQQHQP